jgi:hypothetical protein
MTGNGATPKHFTAEAAEQRRGAQRRILVGSGRWIFAIKNTILERFQSWCSPPALATGAESPFVCTPKHGPKGPFFHRCSGTATVELL